MGFRIESSRWGVAFALTGAASLGHAVVIDFNEFAFDSRPDSVANIGSAFVADGFDFGAVFALVGNPDADFRVASRAHAWQADPGFATIVMTDYPVRVTIERSDGGSFDFASIDLADSANVGVDRNVKFTFNFTGGGSADQTAVLDAVPGLQTFAFNKSGLDSVVMRGVETFVGEFPWYQFDNVNASPVPEPTTALLWGAGLLGLMRWCGGRRV